jgi:hypothetical protein
MPIHARPWVKWLLRRYIILVAIVAFPLLGETLYALWPTTLHADPPPPTSSPNFKIVKQLDDTTWLKRDSERGVICYVYYFHTTQSGTQDVGGISCLPESQLKKE